MHMADLRPELWMRYPTQSTSGTLQRLNAMTGQGLHMPGMPSTKGAELPVPRTSAFPSSSGLKSHVHLRKCGLGTRMAK